MPFNSDDFIAWNSKEDKMKFEAAKAGLGLVVLVIMILWTYIPAKLWPSVYQVPLHIEDTLLNPEYMSTHDLPDLWLKEMYHETPEKVDMYWSIMSFKGFMRGVKIDDYYDHKVDGDLLVIKYRYYDKKKEAVIQRPAVCPEGRDIRPVTIDGKYIGFGVNKQDDSDQAYDCGLIMYFKVYSYYLEEGFGSRAWQD